MPQIRRILFPADLSDQCRAVIPHVRAMAASFHSELVVLNVLEAPPGYYKDWHAYLTLVNWEAIRESRERELSAFVREELKGLPVTRVLEEGEPAYNIVKYAREHSTDLIMMPTHGYGPFRGLLLGSVTAKVLHDSEIPVWTSAHACETPTSASTHCKRILCAVDLTN